MMFRSLRKLMAAGFFLWMVFLYGDASVLAYQSCFSAFSQCEQDDGLFTTYSCACEYNPGIEDWEEVCSFECDLEGQVNYYGNCSNGPICEP